MSMTTNKLLRHQAFGFTLLELLVSLTVIGLLSSMVFIVREQSNDEKLSLDAIALRDTLLQARSLAISTGNAHGVVFHVENAGDGTVFKNASIHDEGETFVSRHWYAIIGPDKEALDYSKLRDRGGELPPLIKPSHNDADTFLTLADYVSVFEKAQIGPRRYLSPGVRILALSDIDVVYEYKKGRHGADDRIKGGHLSSPRPWFGHYDKASKTLYPWGAYNRERDAAAYIPTTGLDYEGYDGTIPYNPALDTNVNPDEVWGRIQLIWDFNTQRASGSTANYPGLVGKYDQDASKLYGRRLNYMGPDTSYLAKKPRPVVNAHWCDFMIYFLPSGTAKVTNGHSRHFFMNRNAYNTTAAGRAEMSIEFEEKKVGGFAVTLARDVDPDGDAHLYNEQNTLTGQPAYHKFETVEDAFASITPFKRIHVEQVTGIAEIRGNEHPHMQIKPEDLLGHSPYPRLDE